MAASFIKRLDELLRDATERGVVDANAAQTLLAMGRERERGRSVVGLAGVLGFLGGGSVIIGIILVIASNWDAIPDPMKIGGFVALLAGVHGLAFYLRATGSEYTKTIESLHFIGGGLFLAGIGLVAQIYHLNARPPNGFLLWLIALVPLAITIGSAPLGLLTIFALFLWAHVEGDYYGSPLEMQGFTSHLLLDVGLAVALLGFAPLLRKREPSLAWVMRACAVLVLFATIYTLGFFRYFAESSHRDGHYATMPLIALGLGGIGLAVGARTMAPEAPAYRDRIVLLLALVLVLGLAALGAAFERIPPGPSLSFFDFGFDRSLPLRDWVITAAAWVLWFALGLWCVAFGARSGRVGYLNVGVLCIGLGIVTRSIDLIGSLAQTGGMYVLGGIVLLVTAYLLERWRRRLVARIASAPAGGT